MTKCETTHKRQPPDLLTKNHKVNQVSPSCLKSSQPYRNNNLPYYKFI